MASVPIPHQFAVGEDATADNVNTYYSSISYLESPPVAMIYQINAQSIPNTTGTPIAFDGSFIDTYNGHSNSVNNTRYTFQVAGIYLITGSGAFSPNVTGVRAASLRTNGTTAVNGSQIILQTVSSVGVNTNVPCSSIMLAVNVNDYIELLVTQTSGGALNTQTGTNNTSTLNICWMHV